MKNTEVTKRISKQEEIDLKKLDTLLSEVMGKENYSISGMPYGYAWDAEVSYSANNKVYFFEFELKSNNKDSMNNCIIKKKKLERMLDKSKGCLLYCNFFNNCTTLHNLKTLPKDKMKIKQLYQKVTEYDDDSEYEYQDYYFFPFDTYKRLYKAIKN